MYCVMFSNSAEKLIKSEFPKLRKWSVSGWIFRSVSLSSICEQLTLMASWAARCGVWSKVNKLRWMTHISIRLKLFLIYFLWTWARLCSTSISGDALKKKFSSWWIQLFGCRMDSAFFRELDEMSFIRTSPASICSKKAISWFVRRRNGKVWGVLNETKVEK